MQFVLKLYKRLGETPLACLERLRLERPVYKDTNMTYLGRLDPMAEGLLLVLAGDTKGKDEFLALDKTYVFEVLWGFETDTYDTLGLTTNTGPTIIEPKKFDTMLQKIRDKKTQAYPPYSSRTVGGKPLHAWAREGRIDQIDLPERNIRIFDLVHVKTRMVKQSDVLDEILKKVDLVKGDFRLKEIKKSWHKTMKKDEMCLISEFKTDVSSGTYIRSLAHEMGKLMGTCALAYGIKRTRVGEYTL